METKEIDAELKADGDNRVIKGYASIFNTVDTHDDVVVPGAFERTIERRFSPPESGQRNRIKTVYQHRKMMPIGRPIVLQEDSKGLYFESRLTEGVQKADETLALVNDGVIDQMSFGYDTVESEMGDFQTGDGESTRVRFLQELKLWELSPVTWGANDGTVVEGKDAFSLLTKLIGGEKEGRVLSEENVERVLDVISMQERALDRLRSLIREATPEDETRIDTDGNIVAEEGSGGDSESSDSSGERLPKEARDAIDNFKSRIRDLKNTD